jgi:hypothetical protein
MPRQVTPLSMVATIDHGKIDDRDTPWGAAVGAARGDAKGQAWRGPARRRRERRVSTRFRSALGSR